MDKQEMIERVQLWVSSNGRTPRRFEIISTKDGIPDISFRKVFGSLETLFHAAGIQSDRKKKVTSEIFERGLEDQLQSSPPKDFKSSKTKNTILVVGDIHAPFVHHPTMELIYKFNKSIKPDVIVQVGDAYDFYAHSKFPRSQNIYKPQEEERLARTFLEEMWVRLKDENPRARCLMLRGNHDVRPIKRALESMPSAEHIVETHMEKLMTFDGVESIHDHREPLEIDGILFHHGYLGKLGDHRDAALMNFVVGHTHRGGVSYRRIRNETLWELNAGFCGDPDSKALSYTASKVQNYTLGFGVIDEFGPRFVHA